MPEMTFKLVGGPCDGECVRQPSEWDGRGFRPPPFIMIEPRRPLPSLAEIGRTTNKAVPSTAVVYHRCIWQDSGNRWYDYRIEKPDS